MMSGDFKRAPLTHQVTVGATSEKMATSLSSAPSPLKIFGNAKKRIRDIFIDMESYVEEAKKFIQGETHGVKSHRSSLLRLI